MSRYIYDEFGNKLKLKGTPIHNTYAGAKQRCRYSSHRNYSNYGGRGIKFEWNSFSEFYYDMMPTWFEGAELDRIDNDGNYNKDNCRWVTRAENARNKTDTIHTYNDIVSIRKLYKSGKFTQCQLAEMFNDSQGNISNIITNKTWNFEENKNNGEKLDD